MRKTRKQKEVRKIKRRKELSIKNQSKSKSKSTKSNLIGLSTRIKQDVSISVQVKI